MADERDEAGGSQENIYDEPRFSTSLNLAPDELCEEERSEDVTSEAESACEEERVRKLFQACDADGDGYIDSQDLLSVCRELNLEDSLDELMRELGADESGRISYDEFVRRRLALRSEIDALRREQRLQQHQKKKKEELVVQHATSLRRDEDVPRSRRRDDLVVQNAEPWRRDDEVTTSRIVPMRRRDNNDEDDRVDLMVQNAASWCRDEEVTRNRRPEPEYVPSSSDNSLGGASGGNKESWEFDSGARDLSPEPTSLQKLVEAAGGSVTSSPAHLLDLANRLHLAAVSSLKSEVSELSGRLHTMAAERDLLEKNLNKSQLEKLRAARESEELRDSLAQRYEERLTELHSVIAELSRKLETQRSNTICEEEEQASEDLNYHSDSEDLSRDLDLSVRLDNLRQTSRDNEEEVEEREGQEREGGVISPDSSELEKKVVEAGPTLTGPIPSSRKPDPPIRDELTALTSISSPMRASPELTAISQPTRDNLAAVKVVTQPTRAIPGLNATSQPIRTGPEPTIKDLLDELANQKEESAKLQGEMSRARLLLAAGRDERDKLRRKIQELESSLATNPGGLSLGGGATNSTSNHNEGSPRHVTLHLLAPPRDEPPPVLKMAERVKLRKVENGGGGGQQVTGPDLCTMDAWSTPVAEQLVLLQQLQGESSVQEMLCRCLPLAASTIEGEEQQQLAGLQHLLPLREFELEAERLRARAEHTRAQGEVMTLALEEARAQSERLTLLVGKHESNSTALALALSYSDASIEAYDVLLALLESELASLVATCRAGGIPASSHSPAVSLAGHADLHPGLALARAADLRQTAEGVASLLLARLERTSSEGSQTHASEGRCSRSDGWRSLDESRLRSHISRLKGERGRVRATVQGLESLHAEPVSARTRNPSAGLSTTEARKMDLETAVLMQELMAMREDKAELRARVHVLERERAELELRLSGQEAQRQAQGAALVSLQEQLRDSETRLADNSKVAGLVTTSAEGKCQSAEGGRCQACKDLCEALAREARLKERLQELRASLDVVSRSADVRHQQSAEVLHEMKRAHGSLGQTLEKCKRKYQARLRKLEHQSALTLERHATQVRILKQQVANLEAQLAAREARFPANETSL